MDCSRVLLLLSLQFGVCVIVFSFNFGVLEKLKKTGLNCVGLRKTQFWLGVVCFNIDLKCNGTCRC